MSRANLSHYPRTLFQVAKAMGANENESKDRGIVNNVDEHTCSNRFGFHAYIRENHANNEQPRERNPGASKLSLVYNSKECGGQHHRGGDANLPCQRWIQKSSKEQLFHE